MAKAKTTTTTRAPKVSAENANAFMAKLFDPLPDAELDDSDLAKIETKAMSIRWDAEMYRYRATEAFQKYVEFSASAAVRFSEMTREEADAKFAPMDTHWATCEALVRMLNIPAPTATALKWKRNTAKASERYLRYDGVLASIAADELRLAQKAA